MYSIRIANSEASGQNGKKKDAACEQLNEWVNKCVFFFSSTLLSLKHFTNYTVCSIEMHCCVSVSNEFFNANEGEGWTNKSLAFERFAAKEMYFINGSPLPNNKFCVCVCCRKRKEELEYYMFVFVCVSHLRMDMVKVIRSFGCSTSHAKIYGFLLAFFSENEDKPGQNIEACSCCTKPKFNFTSGGELMRESWIVCVYIS